jgi:hypothetical protein
MSRKNGAGVEILDLGDTEPDTRPVKIRRAGKEVVLRGYVVGRGCPGMVKAQLTKADDARREAMIQPDGTVKYDEAAWREYLRDALLALIPGLEWIEADLFAGDDAKALNALRYLDAWITREEGEEAEVDSPEAVEATP